MYQALPVYENLMNKEEKTIHRLSITTHDLGQDGCRKFIEELSQYKYGSIVYEALLIAAIIFYARPFSGNERDQNSNADSKVDEKVLQGLTSEEHEMHKILLMLRNKAIAHSEWTHHPTRMHENGLIKSMPFSIWQYFPHPNRDIEVFLSLVDKVYLKANHLIATKTAG